MSKTDWKTCTDHLERELPADDFNTWIRPLQVKTSKGRTVLMAPNEYVRDYISLNHLERIRDIYEHLGAARDAVVVEVSRGNTTRPANAPAPRRAARSRSCRGSSSANRAVSAAARGAVRAIACTTATTSRGRGSPPR